ncbi:MAG: AAA family ATPase [Thermodesulfobacteriota bacterium]|nr:AAA family ATPase [Thermodesulfobacteriota bacterium]
MTIIHPFAGGKGGIGKTFITANLGYLLAKKGYQVLLADLDLGGSNLHTLLDIQNPQTGLNDFLTKATDNLNDTIVNCPIPGLSLLSSKNCSMEIANLYYGQKQKIIREIKKLPYDFILLDLGAGTNFNTLDFFLISSDTVLIFTPEPTSIETGVRFIKAAYYRKLKQVMKKHGLEGILKETATDSGKTSADIIKLLIREDPANETILKEHLQQIRFRFIVNQVRKHKKKYVGETLIKLCKRHFFSDFQFLGNVTYDERVYESILSKQIFISKFPYTRTSEELTRLADTFAQDQPLPGVESSISTMNTKKERCHV